jgi:Ca2+-binding EF-hand superfamily protein
MSSSKNKTEQYENEIKTNFKIYNDNKKDIIQAKKFNDLIYISKNNKKNQFMYDSIKSLIDLKQEEKEENISPEEYISFIENQLNTDKNNSNLKNIFNVFCDSNTQKISWNTFPLIARELGNEELADNLMNVIRQSKLYSKKINYEEFLDIMNSESDEEKEKIDIKSSNIDDKNNKNSKTDSLNEEENFKINDYIENYEEKPTYKQRKIIANRNKKYEDEISSSSKSINKASDDIIIEEKSEENKISNYENDNDNEKIIKRYHRRYRSKKIPNNNENHNSENINLNHKAINKYRKKHSYH